MPGPPAEDRDEERDPVRVDAARRPPRRPDRARRDQRLDLDEDRPAALERRSDDAAGRRLIVLREERPGRIGHLGHAGLAHLEDPDLLGRAKPVLRGAHEAERRVALALEGEDRVDEMFERLRPGQRAVLRHVADEDDRDPLPLRELHQPEGRLADLADAAGRALELADGRGLDGVDDDELRPLVPGDLRDPPDLRLGDDADPVAAGPIEQSQPRGPQPDLGGRLLAGCVQDGARRRRRCPRRPGGGASTCRSPVRHRPGRRSPRPARRPGRDPARRSRSGGAGRPAPRRTRARRAGRTRRRALTTRGAATRGSRTTVSTRLFQARAGAALALPAEEGLAARLADVATLGLACGSGHASACAAAAAISRPRPESGSRGSRRRGCRGRPRGPCRRRSSCPARTCRAGGARRGRPRSCSG